MKVHSSSHRRVLRVDAILSAVDAEAVKKPNHQSDEWTLASGSGNDDSRIQQLLKNKPLKQHFHKNYFVMPSRNRIVKQ